MALYLGLDGGQTATTAVVGDEAGRLVGAGAGGPANHIDEPGGPERAAGSLAEAIRGATPAGAEPRFTAACAGLTGFTPRQQEIARATIRADRLTLVHDSEIAHFSCLLGRPGVVVIAGTGSVALARDEAGGWARTGGWGYLMGDEGSAYWIALQALRAATMMEDGRQAPDPLREAVLAHFDLPDLLALHRQVYAGALSREALAGLAARVGREGDGGRSPAAGAILRLAGLQLAGLAGTAARRAGLPEPLLVGTVGGVWKSETVRASFSSALAQDGIAAQAVPPSVPPALAAYLLALESDGIALDEAVKKNVEATRPALGPLK